MPRIMVQKNSSNKQILKLYPIFRNLSDEQIEEINAPIALPWLCRWLSGKESTCNADVGSIPGWERSPGKGNGNPLQYFLPRKPDGQRSLAGYCLLCHRRAGHDLANKQQHCYCCMEGRMGKNRA